ncbi:MAG: hypothetical protein Mars2KO_21480 [Maribacter sp.]
MRFLISSLLWATLISCTSYPKKKGFTPTSPTADHSANPYFSDQTKDYVYKANIKAFNRSFGGIFIVKKVGANHHRIVFTTELGNKIFDFTFKEDLFEVNHVAKELNRKPLLKILKNDFRVLVTETALMEKSFTGNETILNQARVGKQKHFYFNNKVGLQKIIKVKNEKGKVEVIFSEISDDFAKHIQILHQNLDLDITLKAI